MDKQEILELIDELGARLEGPAEQVYALAVRAQYITSGMLLLASALIVAASVYAVKWSRREWREAQETKTRYGQGDGYMFAGGFAAFAGFVSSIFVFVAINGLLNASFYAIKSLVPGL